MVGLTDPHFWRGKRVFLTGHTGFKGAWLSIILEHFGAQVRGYSLAPQTKPSLFVEANVEKNLKHCEGDIRDLEKLKIAMHEFKPEIVFHLAAQALVRDSYLDPLTTFSTNVMGTANLLEGIRNLDSVKAVVIVTTDKCYENREWQWPYRENEALGGKDPYSSSKACAELVAASYRFSFFKDSSNAAIATARAGNVVGGGDWAKDRLIPDLVKNFVDHKTTLIRNPHAVRPWQHVLEPLSGYLLLGQKLFEKGDNYAEAWNFGPYEVDAREVSAVADMLVKFWSGGVKWQLDVDSHPHEASLLKLDISKSKHRLQWAPSWNIEKCLQETVSWYREYYMDRSAARSLCLRQIKDYFLL